MLTLLFLGGCEQLPPEQAFAVRDSAGVEIVEHGSLPDRTAFVLGAPEFRVGWSATDPQFGRIYSGVLLENGGSAVADVNSDEVVLLAPNGQLDTILGGGGDGPEEFASPVVGGTIGGDTVLIHDVSRGRLVKVTRHGFVGSSGPVGAFSQYMSIASGTDRTFMTPSGFRPFVEEAWVRGTLVSAAIDGESTDTLLVFDWRESMTRGATNDPFPAWGLLDVSSELILYVRADEARVKVYDHAGGLVREIRWSEEPPQLTDELWAKYEEYRRGLGMRGSEDEIRVELAELRAAVEPPIPYATAVFGDDRGNVWVSDFAPDLQHPKRYRVFRSTGEWLGWVEAEPRMQITDIANGRVLAIQRNGFDVEAVVVFPLMEG